MTMGMSHDLMRLFALMGQGQEQEWVDTAENDPAIQAWWKDISKNLKLPKGVTIAEFMSRDTSYDYKTAIEAGLRPSLQKEDNRYHWGSSDPRTGRILKAKWHPTYHKEIEARRRQGQSR